MKTSWSFWPKVWKIFRSNSEKKSEKKNKKVFLPQFLLWTRRWTFENHAKGFWRKSNTVQNFWKNFKPKIVHLHTRKLVLTISWSFLARSLNFFLLKSRKNSEMKNKKTNSSAIFTLNTKIDVWEPLQNFLQKIQNVSNLYKKISSHKMFLWTLRR